MKYHQPFHKEAICMKANKVSWSTFDKPVTETPRSHSKTLVFIVDYVSSKKPNLFIA